MAITPIAAILVPLSIFLFLFAPSLLYSCMVFSLPFSATAVANVGFMSATSGVQATILFGSLWMLKEGPNALKKSGLWQSPQMRTSVRQLRLFLCAVVLSLAMPWWIHGR